MKIQYHTQFNALLTCYAFSRTHESPEETNSYYRKLTEYINEAVAKELERKLEARSND